MENLVQNITFGYESHMILASFSLGIKLGKGSKLDSPHKENHPWLKLGLQVIRE